MSIIPAAMSGVPITLQDAKSAADGGVVVAIPPSITRHSVIIKGSAGINAGKVQVETADAPDYAGTWAAVGAEQTAVADTELAVTFDGRYRFLRARISTQIGVGTVTVTYVGSHN